jgi:L-fuconolactonase
VYNLAWEEIPIRIDAHQHFWKLDRGDYGWLTPDIETIYKNFHPEDIHPLLKEANIDHTVVVQAAPTIQETEYLLELYEEHDIISGVVGWLDMDSPDFKQQFKRLRNHDGFVGLRPMIQDIEDDQWVLRPQVLKNIELLVEEGFPLDILVLPKHLPYVIELFKKLPKLRAIVNHAAKPYIKDQLYDPWRDHMEKIASYEHVMCKLSGLITEADAEWSVEDLQPIVHHVIGCFGTDSVMFGSDWPVCLLAGSYQEVHDTLCEALPENVTADDKKKIFGGNAARFYKRLRLR